MLFDLFVKMTIAVIFSIWLASKTENKNSTLLIYNFVFQVFSHLSIFVLNYWFSVGLIQVFTALTISFHCLQALKVHALKVIICILLSDAWNTKLSCLNEKKGFLEICLELQTSSYWFSLGNIVNWLMFVLNWKFSIWLVFWHKMTIILLLMNCFF